MLGGNVPCEPPRAAGGSAAAQLRMQNWNASKAPGREGQEGEGGRRADRPTNRQMHKPAAACGRHSATPVGVVCNWRCLSCGLTLFLSRCLVRYYVGRTVHVCWQTRERGRHAKEADGGEVVVVASEGYADKQSSVSIQVYQMLFITVIPPLWIS